MLLHCVIIRVIGCWLMVWVWGTKCMLGVSDVVLVFVSSEMQGGLWRVCRFVAVFYSHVCLLLVSDCFAHRTSVSSSV